MPSQTPPEEAHRLFELMHKVVEHPDETEAIIEAGVRAEQPSGLDGSEVNPPEVLSRHESGDSTEDLHGSSRNEDSTTNAGIFHDWQTRHEDEEDRRWHPPLAA